MRGVRVVFHLGTSDDHPPPSSLLLGRKQEQNKKRKRKSFSVLFENLEEQGKLGKKTGLNKSPCRGNGAIDA